MSTITQHPFYTAYTYLLDMFGVEISEDLFETMGYVAWTKIGNKQTRMYKTQLVPEKDLNYGWYVDIPCNADIIESVTTNYEDYQKTSSKSDYPGINSLPTENFVEYMKFGTNDQYISGKLVKYRQLGDKLYLTEPYTLINIL